MPDTNEKSFSKSSDKILNRDKNEVDPKLLDILVCPLSKTPLIYDKKANELISNSAGLAFPIRNCLLYTSPSPRDGLLSRMPSSA